VHIGRTLAAPNARKIIKNH